MSSKSLSELLEILNTTPDSVQREKSDQDKFFEDIGAKHHETDRVAADVVYIHYLKWKEEHGEKVTLKRYNFFKKAFGFPKWVKKSVYPYETKYWLNKDAFPVDDELRREMRTLWRIEKKGRKISKALRKREKEIRKNIRASKRTSSPK